VANWCNGNLMVVGPATEVRRFVGVARERPPARRTRGARRPRKSRRTAAVLSFTNLLPLDATNEEDATSSYGTDSLEPLDPWRSKPEEIAPGILKVEYGSAQSHLRLEAPSWGREPCAVPRSDPPTRSISVARRSNPNGSRGCASSSNGGRNPPGPYWRPA
jgi:hypothetical protein